MSLMAQTAQVIAAGFEDGRFGNDPIDWLMLVYERMYRIFLSVIKSRPKARGDGTLETAPQIKTRIIAAHKLRIERNGETNTRHIVSDLKYSIDVMYDLQCFF